MPDRFPNLSAPATTTKERADEDNYSTTNLKVKKFTKETTFKGGELKSVQRSIAMQQQTLNKILNILESILTIKRLGGI